MKTRFLCLCLLSLSSCATNPAETKADRATYQAITPEYLHYVDSDDNLNQAAKARRHRTVETWDARIRAKEEGGQR